MSFNNYINLPDEVRKKLPFLGEAYYYLFKDSGGKTLRGILFEITEENMNKAWKRLTGDKGEIVSGDKVYILPNCRIPMYKLTDYLEEVGARQTGDVTEATKIIGHERVKEKVKRQAFGSTLLMEIDSAWLLSAFNNRDWIQEEMQKKEREEYERLTSGYHDLTDLTELSAKETVLSKAIWTRWWNFQGSIITRRFITPTGAWILYNHLLNKIPVINDDEIFEKIGKPTILDAESYSTLRDMLASQDGDSQKTGAELLANCDINQSLYWIWKLAGQYHSVVNRSSSFKNIRLFIRMSKWDQLAGMIAEDFIEYLYNRNLLTKEYFSELVKEAAIPYANRTKSELFEVVIVPSAKYSEYAEGQTFEFNKAPENQEVEVIEETEEDE